MVKAFNVAIKDKSQLAAVLSIIPFMFFFQNQCAHFTLHDNFMMFYYYQCYAHFASILLFQSIKVHFQSLKSQESSSIFSSYPLRYG